MNQATKPAPLGRGLSALFGDGDKSYQAMPTAVAPVANEKSLAPRMIAITKLQPGSYQPRYKFDEDAINSLADSIRQRGILQPLLVRPLPDSKENYEIIAGERRWRAAQLAGLHEVPVVLREITDQEALEFGLIENIQRQDLSALEEAEGYRRLMEEFQHTQDNLAKVVGKSRSHIANTMRLLTLPPGVKQMIEAGTLSAGHARTLVTARDPLALAEEIVSKGMNVRQAEALAKRQGENPQVHVKKNAKPADANIIALEKGLERDLGLKVDIESRGAAGSVTFHYQNNDQLTALLKKLRG